jgi:hypothetical protein
MAFFLVFILATTALGCGEEEWEVSKTTGGGWFYDDITDAKVTFGFTAKPTEPDPEDPDVWYLAKGQFQLIDHSEKIRVHGTFYWALRETPTQTTDFWGWCTVNGVDGFLYEAGFWDEGESGPDKGDYIGFYAFKGSESYYWQGELQGGNIKIHKK